VIFAYEDTGHERRHGPGGYRNYRFYKKWLRDEFTFRCIYCLFREQWVPGHTTFGVDHFVPQSVDRSLALDYQNLLYLCNKCNSNKSASVGSLLDPCKVGLGKHLTVTNDGQIHAKSKEAAILIDFLQLDDLELNDFRKRMLALWEKKEEIPEIKGAFGFPRDLPDLRKLNPPHNSKPEGIDSCYYVLREQGKLPEAY